MAPAEVTRSQSTIREAVAAFDDAGALQQAVSDLQSHGFDRSDLSFVSGESSASKTVSTYGDTRAAEDDAAAPREAPIDNTDIRQARVLGTSMAATVAAFAAAGFTVLTGGAGAVALGAAALAAGGVGAAGATLGKAASDSQQNAFDQQIEHGGVLLWVRLRDVDNERRAVEILKQHGAHDVHVRDVADTATTRA